MTDRGEGKDAASRTDPGAAGHHDMRDEFDPISELDIGPDVAEGSDRDALPQAGARAPPRPEG